MKNTNKNKIEIRQATLDNAGDISFLSTQLGYPSSETATVQRLQNILHLKDHTVFVACSSSGEIVGWIHVSRVLRIESDPFAEIGGFVVSERVRNQGIGTELLNAAELWVKQNIIGKLRVRSRIERLATKQFYLKRGFIVSKEQTVFEKNIPE